MDSYYSHTMRIERMVKARCSWMGVMVFRIVGMIHKMADSQILGNWRMKTLKLQN